MAACSITKGWNLATIAVKLCGNFALLVSPSGSTPLLGSLSLALSVSNCVRLYHRTEKKNKRTPGCTSLEHLPRWRAPPGRGVLRTLTQSKLGPKLPHVSAQGTFELKVLPRCQSLRFERRTIWADVAENFQIGSGVSRLRPIFLDCNTRPARQPDPGHFLDGGPCSHAR